MPEFSKLEWLIPRQFPNLSFEEDIYCMGHGQYVLKNKDKNGPEYYLITGYGDNDHEVFIPEVFLDTPLIAFPTFQVNEQIQRKDWMVKKALEYLDTLPEYTLISFSDVEQKLFGTFEFDPPATWQYPSFALEESMREIYYRDLFSAANTSGIFFAKYEEEYLECLSGYNSEKKQYVLRKNYEPKRTETEEETVFRKETISSHSVRVVYSKKEERITDIQFAENPSPKRKHIPGFQQKREHYHHGNFREHLKDELFLAAFDNDLEKLKELIKEGRDINTHEEEYGYSLLTLWLEGYYRKADDDFEEMIYTAVLTDFPKGYPSDLLCIPLEHRDNRLFEAVEWMLDNGLVLNDRYGDDRLIEETPLSLAVQNMDYYMTEYLLEKGADPYAWIWTEPSERYEGVKEDHLGMIIVENLDDSDDFVLSAVWLKFAKLLRKYNYTGEFHADIYYSLILHEENDSVEYKRTGYNLY